MSEELKPCPFCGERAKIKATNKSYGFTIWCQCENSDCAAMTVGYCPEMNDEDHSIESIESCFRKAVEAWNRRANDGKVD